MPPHHHRIAPQLESRARRLRRDSTFPERLLWSRLRVLQNLKFRRQAAIDKFVADDRARWTGVVKSLNISLD